MQRFKNILVCVDLDSDRHPALERAAILAQLNKARVKIVAVHEKLPTWTTMLLPSKTQEWEQMALREKGRQLDLLCEATNKNEVSFSSKLLAGKPFVEIIREAQADAHDLILKDLSLDKTALSSVISSTDMHLLRKSPTPVWLIKPEVASRFKCILAAVDPLPGEVENNQSLNTKILELATSLARREHCKLFIVRVYESIAQEFLATDLESTQPEAYLEHIQTVRVKNDKEFIGKFTGASEAFDVRFLFGDPATMITDIAQKEGTDLIVMGTVKSAGIPGFLMGRTAENVLRQVNCSVLGVKPDGFISPLAQ